MPRRQKIIIAAIAAIIVLLLIFILLLFLNRPVSEPAVQPVNQNEGLLIPEDLLTASSVAKPIESIVDDPDIEANLKAIAMTFAERFGSYSNESNFMNLNDLKDLMTVRLKAEMDNLKISQTAQPTDGQEAYYGITSRALRTEITGYEAEMGSAEIRVSCQRLESRGSTLNPDVFYQDIMLKLRETDEGWKVDSAVWQ